MLIISDLVGSTFLVVSNRYFLFVVNLSFVFLNFLMRSLNLGFTVYLTFNLSMNFSVRLSV